ncbi:histidine kinase [Idiomarina sp. A28L]|uniref:sensor histidine kinase n=1 Tax=Idiomarina sp. A28L TaxID=1036674 RepID=UPI00021389A9|nr:sensor histidine kinase [Idiomarina sp. A28L]EGN74975.1 histidine kinase [Idiomarina sp. A28L]
MNSKLDSLCEIQQQLRNLLMQEQDELRELARRVWNQQELERNQLAHDLHDGVGQSMAILSRRLKQRRENSEDDEDLYLLADNMMEDIRTMARLMRPTVLDDLGLHAALRWLARTVFKKENVQVKLDIDVNDELPDDLNIMVFRIAQEAFTNILKHSGATEVRVFAARNGQAFRMDIIDNGKGFVYDTVKKGVGLRSMFDRAAAFDATLNIQTRPSNGTQLTVQVRL